MYTHNKNCNSEYRVYTLLVSLNSIIVNFLYINKRNPISSVFHFLLNHSYQFTYYYFPSDFCIANTITQSLIILPSLWDPPWPFCSHQSQPAIFCSNLCSPKPSYSININYKYQFIIFTSSSPLVHKFPEIREMILLTDMPQTPKRKSVTEHVCSKYLLNEKGSFLFFTIINN